MTAPGPAVDALTARFVAALGRRAAMAELMAVASLGGTPQLARAVALLGSRAEWTRTESYASDEALFAGYAHASLRGDEDLVLGLVLLGPGVHYRAHHHPAEEYYIPLGAIRWDHGQGWVDEPAGELIHHEPWQPHAMETGERAALLAYLWFDEIDVPSVFVEG